jgi:Sulfotransferase domain
MASFEGNLPNLIIIGAQKCGTSSLHYYLSLHPEICMSREKELKFFASNQTGAGAVKAYKANFRRKAKIYGESSPDYTNYPQQSGVAERMAALIPQAKLIYIIRDPLERIVSHYVHLYSRNLEDRPIDEAIKSLENNRYLYRSQYFTQLQQYTACFPETQILVLTTESLLSQRLDTLQQVFKFLDVDERFNSRQFSAVHHRSSEKRRKTAMGQRIERSFGRRLEMSLPYNARWLVRLLLYWSFSRPIRRPVLGTERIQALQAALKPDLDQLRAYTGQRFSDWLV